MKEAVEKTLSEKYRENEYWELSGVSEDECPMPWPLLAHVHEWNEDGYCDICGADGNA